MKKRDYNLIYFKSENARMSIKDLSSHLKKSPQRLKYSISLLEKEGLIKNPHGIFDYSYFGLILFRVYFKSGYINEEVKKDLISKLLENPYITSIYELTGEFDLVIEFACPNPSKFNKEFKKVTSLTKVLSDYKIILNIVTYVYPRSYLLKGLKFENFSIERIIGGDREIKGFNENEILVIKTLLSSPLIRFTDLSKISGLNVKTVKSIMKNLLKKNFIKGFRYTLDVDKLDITKFRIFLKLHNLDLQKESEFMDYITKNEEIIELNKTVGDWDVEIDIESLDKNKVRKIILNMRERFKHIIEKFNLIEMYNYHRKSYLPLYLFKEEPISSLSKVS